MLALVEALSWLTADTVRDDDEILPVNGLQSSIGEASKKMPKPGLFQASTQIEKWLAVRIDDEESGPSAWTPLPLIYQTILGLALFSLISVRLIVSTVRRAARRI